MAVSAILLALATAAAWALVTQFQKRGLDCADGRSAALIVVLSFAGLFWSLAPFFIEWHWFTNQATLIFLLSGIIVPGLAQQFQMLSVEKLGPTLTAVVGAFVPVFAVVPAVLFLGERVSLQSAFGIAVMVAGVAFAVRAKAQGVGSFSLALIWFAIGAAACRGLAQPLSKAGLVLLAEPFFATLVMVTSAAVLIGVTHLMRDHATVRFKAGPQILWLVAAGVVLGLGFLTLYAALNRGPVVVVAPFIATMPIWVVVYDHFIFKHDRIGGGHAAAAVVVTLGAVLLVTA